MIRLARGLLYTGIKAFKLFPKSITPPIVYYQFSTQPDSKLVKQENDIQALQQKYLSMVENAVRMREDGEIDDALDQFKKILTFLKTHRGEINPDSAVILTEAALTLYLKEEYQEALKLFDEADEIISQLDQEQEYLRTNSFKLRGLVLIALGDYSQAYEYFARALQNYNEGQLDNLLFSTFHIFA